MAAPDPEGMTLLAKVLGAGAAVVVPVWGFVKLWDKKADKHTVNNELQTINNQLAEQRGMLAESESKNEERHRELLMHLLKRD